jgi:hypothetical protein
MGHSYSNYIALQAIKPAGAATADDEMAGLFASSKSGLKPIYEKIVAIVNKFGSDVEIAPKKAFVSLRRSKQFGLLKPSTADRLDLGLILRGVKPVGRLEASGSFNAMFTHRVRITRLADVDSDVTNWLKDAYDAA